MATTDDAQSFDFNRGAAPLSEAIAVSVWGTLYPRIADAKRRLDGPYVAVVEDRSSLQLDDRYLGPWRGGSLHVTAMAAAADSLLAVQAILEQVTSGDGVLPMSALYPMLCTALECSSLAIYLLEPPDRDERLRRNYWVASDDAKYADAFAQEFKSKDGVARLEGTTNTILSLIALRPSLGAPKSFRFRQIKYSDLVFRADSALDADPANTTQHEMSLVAWWKLFSGLSHGKQWAFIAALDRSEAVVDVEDESARVKMTSSAASIAVGFQRATEALECALRLYGQRSKASWNQAEDASEPTRLPPSQQK